MNNSQLFLGIDGGGSKTEVLICDRQGTILGRGLAGPSNPNSVSINDAKDAITQAYNSAVQSIHPDSITAAFVCVPGLQKHITMDGLSEIIGIPPSLINLQSDIENSFAAALGFQFGVVVLAGTGSFAVGKNKNERICIKGGWGPTLGDEGSGYAIGVAAIQAAIKSYEGRRCETLLVEEIKKYFHLDDFAQLKSHFYHLRKSQQVISRLVFQVVEVAQNGDELARKVLQDAAQDLANLAISVINQLDMDDPVYYVSMVGGVSRIGSLITDSYKDAIGKECPSIKYIDPRTEPVVGSLFLALKSSGIQVTDPLIEKLAGQYKQISQRK